jgi:hypothetical protein
VGSGLLDQVAAAQAICVVGVLVLSAAFKLSAQAGPSSDYVYGRLTRLTLRKVGIALSQKSTGSRHDAIRYGWAFSELLLSALLLTTYGGRWVAAAGATCFVGLGIGHVVGSHMFPRLSCGCSSAKNHAASRYWGAMPGLLCAAGLVLLALRWSPWMDRVGVWFGLTVAGESTLLFLLPRDFHALLDNGRLRLAYMRGGVSDRELEELLEPSTPGGRGLEALEKAGIAPKSVVHAWRLGRETHVQLVALRDDQVLQLHLVAQWSADEQAVNVSAWRPAGKGLAFVAGWSSES